VTPTILDGTLSKHKQLEGILRENIQSGFWKAGDKLPSENDLIRQYGVSRTLVRNVLSGLVYEGLIYRAHGKGSFVMPKKVHAHTPHQQLIREQLEKKGHSTYISQLQLEEITPTSKIAHLLQLEENSVVYAFSHVRYVDGQPFSNTISYLPKSLFPGLERYDLGENSLLDVLKNVYGFTRHSANEFLEAMFPERSLSKLLDISEGFPLLKLEQLNFSESDIPFEFCRIFFRGDRIRLHFDYNR